MWRSFRWWHDWICPRDPLLATGRLVQSPQLSTQLFRTYSCMSPFEEEQSEEDLLTDTKGVFAFSKYECVFIVSDFSFNSCYYRQLTTPIPCLCVSADSLTTDRTGEYRCVDENRRKEREGCRDGMMCVRRRSNISMHATGYSLRMGWDPYTQLLILDPWETKTYAHRLLISPSVYFPQCMLTEHLQVHTVVWDTESHTQNPLWTLEYRAFFNSQIHYPSVQTLSFSCTLYAVYFVDTVCTARDTGSRQTKEGDRQSSETERENCLSFHEMKATNIVGIYILREWEVEERKAKCETFAHDSTKVPKLTCTPIKMVAALEKANRRGSK